MPPTKPREQALRDLAGVVAEEIAIIRTLTPREAAERAWHPGGPSVDELEQYAARVLSA